MTHKNLFIVRGLPGSGKNTFIDALDAQATIIGSDDFLVNQMGAYEWSPERHRDALQKADAAVVSAMERGDARIFLHGVFDEAAHMQKFFDLAKVHGYTVFTVIVENRHGGVSIHGVPPETMTRFRQDFDIKL